MTKKTPFLEKKGPEKAIDVKLCKSFLKGWDERGGGDRVIFLEKQGLMSPSPYSGVTPMLVMKT